ncbi:unnamed protein product [Adineta ricciae]|uniref:Uncharacterized protein n=1 Tax=Adineta ricciae TaxID=249248 RepID=A0A815JIQ4_ADIRI|nr:unnamed protein product [Adineta ricciae]CAF1381662.1 unnamed protein product [Adineta ricciae]
MYTNTAKQLVPNDHPYLKAIIHAKCAANPLSLQKEVTEEIAKKKTGIFRYDLEQTVFQIAETFRYLGDEEEIITYCKNLIEKNAEIRSELDLHFPSFDKKAFEKRAFVLHSQQLQQNPIIEKTNDIKDSTSLISEYILISLNDSAYL